MSEPRKPQAGQDSADPTTHFGYKTVRESEKAEKVAEVVKKVVAGESVGRRQVGR